MEALLLLVSWESSVHEFAECSIFYIFLGEGKILSKRQLVKSCPGSLCAGLSSSGLVVHCKGRQLLLNKGRTV